MWMASAPTTRMMSRLMTTAAIQNGSASSQVSVTNDEISSSLSAIGSRKAPSRLWIPRWRATYPSSRSVSAAAAKTASASPGRW